MGTITNCFSIIISLTSTTMKKLLFILLALPFLMVSCRKDASEKAAGKYEGYIIQGKMKNVINTDGGTDRPYVLILMADKKAKLVNLNGESTLNYSVEKDKIVLDDNGYFNLKDGQITDWLIAGLNFSTATLSQQPATGLRGKKFSGNIRYQGFNQDIATEIDFEAATDQLSFIGDATKYTYTPIGNVAAYIYDTPTKSSMFVIVENGKLNYQTYSAQYGFSTGILDPK